MSNRSLVPYDTAVQMLEVVEGRVHTYRQAGGGGPLIGADWGHEKILAAIQKHGVELAGEVATAMKHGLTLCDDTGWLFIATKES